MYIVVGVSLIITVILVGKAVRCAQEAHREMEAEAGGADVPFLLPTKLVIRLWRMVSFEEKNLYNGGLLCGRLFSLCSSPCWRCFVVARSRWKTSHWAVATVMAIATTSWSPSMATTATTTTIAVGIAGKRG